jgi:hypothetical protein
VDGNEPPVKQANNTSDRGLFVGRGANMPYDNYEAEDGVLGGGAHRISCRSRSRATRKARDAGFQVAGTLATLFRRWKTLQSRCPVCRSAGPPLACWSWDRP